MWFQVLYGEMLFKTAQRVLLLHRPSLACGIVQCQEHYSTVKQRFPEDGPKLEPEGTKQGGSRHTEPGNMAQGVRKRLLASLHPADISEIGKERKYSNSYRFTIPGNSNLVTWRKKVAYSLWSQAWFSGET
jgi:hypothetical protein